MLLLSGLMSDGAVDGFVSLDSGERKGWKLRCGEQTW